MKSTRIAVLLVCAALLAAGEAGQGQGRNENRVHRARQPIPNQYIVVLNGGEDADQVGLQAAAVHGGQRIRTFRRALNGFTMRMPAAAAAALASDPRVRFIEEDGIVTASQIQTNAPAGLDRIDQRQLPLDGTYSYDETASAVRVHIIDSGVRPSHQEFEGRAIVAGDFVDDDGDGDPFDVANDDGDPSTLDGADCNCHRTHVAGIIGGATYGVAKQASLYAYRILGCDGNGTVSGAIAAIDAITADSYRPAVVNMSLGGDPSDALDNAVRSAIADGLPFVVAAGNSFSDASHFSPARVAEAITVGASDVNDIRAWFTNFGPALDLFAPGVDITSSWFSADDATMVVSGTSMAAPHVTGVVALYLSHQPNLTPAVIHAQVTSAATPNLIVTPGAGSPNRLLYSNLDHLSAPAVDLIGLDAGTKIMQGRPLTVVWTASDPDGISSIDVMLSIDSGGSFAPLAGCSGLDPAQRQCVWTNPNPITDHARVKVEVRDTTGDIGVDQSSGDFSIVSLPDLTTTAATHGGVTNLAPGGSLLITDTVRNVGNFSSTVPATTRYYLSVDTQQTVSDLALTGSRSVPPLGPDAESTSTTSLTVPTWATAGTYNLLACADASRVVTEIDETNNCAVAAPSITIEYSDLVTAAVSAPPGSVALGNAFAITQTVRNDGAVNASSSISRFYLSTDGTKSAGDTLLTGTLSVALLGPGAVASSGRSVTVPATAVPGSYLVLACADDLTAVKETDETNNCAASSSMVLIGSPDLVAVAVADPPSTAAAGSSFAVSDTVQNQSSIAARTSTTRYYLSNDGARSADDVLMSGNRSVAALDPGGSSAGGATATVPASLAPGNYRLLACADDMDVNDETNESNNCVASAAAVTIAQPDLMVTSVSHTPTAVAPGSSVTISDTTQNSGPVPSGTSSTRYYLSVDGSKSADDLLLSGSRFVGGLAAGAPSNGSRTATIPATVASGTYNVLACADDSDAVNESNEGNNCRAATATLLVGMPDLVTMSVGNPPAAASAGSTFTVTESVSNQSAIGIGASTSRYYLSTDAILDSGDVLLTGTRTILSLGANQTSAGSRIVTIPSTSPDGTYRLLACADDTHAISESNEANNCLASSGTVSIAMPDLVMTSISDPPATVAANISFSIADTVQNAGAGPAVATTIRYYLSSNQVRDAGDLLLTVTRSVPALAPGASSAATRWLKAPTGTLPGPYYVLACADDLDNASESDESNNCIATATTVMIGG
jgi:subtilase family serine protease